MKNWLYRWGPAFVIMAIIFIASATPGASLPEFGYEDFFVKKGGHMLGYALLAASYYRAFRKEAHTARWRFLMALSLTILYAASDEWHQRFTAGRNASPVDVGIDAIGGLIGITVLRWIEARRV